MEKVTALFIGGPFDGLRRKVFSGQEYVQVESLPPLEPARITALGQMPQAAMVKSAVYKRYPFSSGRGVDADVYVYGDADPLLTLLNGYRQYSGHEVRGDE